MVYIQNKSNIKELMIENSMLLLFTYLLNLRFKNHSKNIFHEVLVFVLFYIFANYSLNFKSLCKYLLKFIYSLKNTAYLK